MPPLRQRIQDMPELTAHFLRRFSAEMGMKPPALSDEALTVLKSYSFPGNVRELKNIIERALIESGGDSIQPAHLHLQRTAASTSQPADAHGTNKNMAGSLPLNLAEAEDILIQRALQETGGNIADAARLLGVHRTRIYRKLAREEPERPESSASFDCFTRVV
jgi:DNA-binding NtrC family response regulator